MRTVLVSILVFLLSACALVPPKKPTDTAKKHLMDAGIAAGKGNKHNARIHVDSALWLPGEEAQVKLFLHAEPAVTALYVEASAEHIKATNSPAYVSDISTRLDLISLHEILPTTDVENLRDSLIERARQGNLDDSISFTLRDKVRNLGLSSPEHTALILGRSIDATRATRSGSGRQAIEILSYAADPSLPASQRKTIENSLDSIYITKEELPYAKGLFPAFAKRRHEALARLDGAEVIEVGKSTWSSLSPGDRMAIEKDIRVSVLADQSYGTIVDIQGVDRSTAATNHGAAIGSGVAQIAYIGRAFDGGSYSPWMQLGLGVLGAIVGSAADRPAVQQYQHRYAVKLGDGEMQSFDQTNGDPFHHPAGTCVRVPGLEVLSQKVCRHTPQSLRAGVMGESIPGVTELHARK